ncbi:MAG: LysR family transcriptional regulator [Paracoccaceae bacterium]
MSVKPPRPRGPHLNAMRCFETAARLGGFAAAAEELSVTPGAVSQQVKALEDWVSAPLFERRSQGVVLTPLGASVVIEFSSAFDSLGSALQGLRTSAPMAAVNIAALPSVAQLWLSPRLPPIREAFPGHAISITALESPPNLMREMFDLSIFFGSPDGGLNQRVLKDDLILPVCAPAIAARLQSPDDLTREAMLHDAVWIDDWRRWLDQSGCSTITATDGPVFSLYSIAVDEARNGAGVLMGHQVLLDKYLRSGELVAPFTGHVTSGKSLVLETAVSARSSALLDGIVDMLVS